MIFKNLTVLALNGRRIFDTWYRTRWLLENGVVDLRPLIIQELDLEDIDEAMRILEAGEACKVILRPWGGAGMFPGAWRASAGTRTPTSRDRTCTAERILVKKYVILRSQAAKNLGWGPLSRSRASRSPTTPDSSRCSK